MSRPKVGKHARIREKAVPVARQFFRAAEADAVYEVAAVDPGYGRKAVYLKSKTGDVFSLWANQVQALPRCRYCDSEQHNGKNCPDTKEAA